MFDFFNWLLGKIHVIEEGSPCKEWRNLSLFVSENNLNFLIDKNSRQNTAMAFVCVCGSLLGVEKKLIFFTTYTFP